MLRLLDDRDELVRRRTLGVLAGCPLTPALEEALLDPAADAQRKQHVVHFVLNRSGPLSEKALEFLTQAMTDPDPSLSQTACNVLSRSVPQAARGAVADKALDALRQDRSPGVRSNVLRVLDASAGEEHLALLEHHAANPMLGDHERAAIERTLAAIRRRLDAGR